MNIVEHYIFIFTLGHPDYYFSLLFQYINQTGFRACLKELYETKYDPLSVSYTVLSGSDKVSDTVILVFLINLYR